MDIDKMRFDIVGSRRIWYTLSGILLVLSLVFMIRNVATDPTYRSPLRLGIDFTGGVIIQIQFDKDEMDVSKVSSETIYRIVNKATPTAPQVQITNNSEGKLVHIRSDSSLIQEDVKKALMEQFSTEIGPNREVLSEEITPVISHELIIKALQGLFWGSLLILIYITWRMSFDFALFAVVALLHDVLILCGAFAMLQIEISSYFVAAALTIVGYSINDTIVIYDRIRENSKVYRSRPFDRVVNFSLLQTMARSINTIMTTLFTILALFFFGGESIKHFTLALAIGITCGGYSSIFNASQLLVSYRLYKARGRMISAEETLKEEELAAKEEDTLLEEEEVVKKEGTAAKKKRKRRY